MPADGRVKLRMKIGVHELDAEGPRELVIAQLDTWMRAAGLGTMPAVAGAASDPALRSLFRVDPERQLITLRARVNGRRRNADAALMLLHGFDTCLGAGDGAETPAARLTSDGTWLSRPLLGCGSARAGASVRSLADGAGAGTRLQTRRFAPPLNHQVVSQREFT